MSTRALPLLAAILALLPLAASAEADDYVPGEVLVGHANGSVARVETQPGQSVGDAIEKLRAHPKVRYAVPNYKVRAAQFTPNDPYLRKQWNFTGRYGIDMPEAWALAEAAGAPGGRGATVAVIDSGVAYETRGAYKRNPDLHRSTFVHPWDFVGRDAHPNDRYGHGTHVAGTIAQATNNGFGVAGAAYGAKIMPLKVLDDYGLGDSFKIARAIRFAARHGANVINLSLEFEHDLAASEIPEIISAIEYAHRRGVVIVAAAGNYKVPSMRRVAYPARALDVIAVGATTRHGCRAKYSSYGAYLDLVAPGGGVDAAPSTIQERLLCRPETPGSWIFQETFLGRKSVRKFGLPPSYEGTSMAAPHVSAIAALLIATHRLGEHPTPDAVEQRIEQTARDLGRPGLDSRYGWGLADAAAALR